MSTLHCVLENVANLYVSECQKVQHYRARSTEERRIKNKKNVKSLIILLCAVQYINCAIIAMLYTHSIGNQP